MLQRKRKQLSPKMNLFFSPTPTRVRESALWEIHCPLSQSWKKRQVDEKENLYPTWRGRGPSYLLISGQDGAQRWRPFPPGAAASPGAQAEQKQHHPNCGPPGVAHQPAPSPTLSD